MPLTLGTRLRPFEIQSALVRTDPSRPPRMRVVLGWDGMVTQLGRPIGAEVK